MKCLAVLCHGSLPFYSLFLPFCLTSPGLFYAFILSLDLGWLGLGFRGLATSLHWGLGLGPEKGRPRESEAIPDSILRLFVFYLLLLLMIVDQLCVKL